jgi:hypothetical protein
METELAPISKPNDTTEADVDAEDDAASDAASDDEALPTTKTTPPAHAGSDNSRQVAFAEAQTYAKESGLLFFEASAKTGLNVGEVFTEIGKSRFPHFASSTAAQRRSLVLVISTSCSVWR